MATRIKHRRATATSWAVNNPILASGEKGYETDTKKWKSGDGTTPWNSLVYDIHSSDIAPPTLSVVLGTGNVANDHLDMNGNAIKNVPNPVDIGDAANKAYVDQKTTNLRKLIGPIDCSSHPVYPSGNVGDTYEVIEPGKVGGEDGKIVHRWDEVVCSQSNPGGLENEVGAYWYIVQGDVLEATPEVSGTIRIASEEEVASGEVDWAAVTPYTLARWFENVISNLVQMVAGKNAENGYVGLSGFMIAFKNAADSFTSYFSNSNTASRTYGFPDKSGTVALTDDIPSVNNRKITASCHVEVLGTAVTTEEIYWSYLIPGGTLTNGDSFDIDALLSFQSTNGSGKNLYIRINNQNQITGGIIMANVVNTNNTGNEIPLRILQKIKAKAKTGQTLEAGYLTTGAGTIGVMTTVVSANWNLANDIYVLVTGKKAVPGDTMTLRYAELYINKQ